MAGCISAVALLALSGCALPDPVSQQLQRIGLAPTSAADDSTLRPDLSQGVRIRPVSGERRMVEVARLRTNPSVNAGIIQTMRKGDPVSLAGKVDGYTWYLITLPDGRAGYLHATSLTETNDATERSVASRGSTFGGYVRYDGGGGGGGGQAGGGNTGTAGSAGGGSNSGNAGSAGGGGGGGNTGNAGSAL